MRFLAVLILSIIYCTHSQASTERQIQSIVLSKRFNQLCEEGITYAPGWSYRSPRSTYVDDKYVYLSYSELPGEYNILHAFELKTGKETQLHIPKGIGFKDFYRVGSTMYLLGQSDLAVYDMNTQNVLNVIPVPQANFGKQFYNYAQGMDFYNNKLYIVNGLAGVSVFDLATEKIIKEIHIQFPLQWDQANLTSPQDQFTIMVNIAIYNGIAYILSSAVGDDAFAGITEFDLEKERVLKHRHLFRHYYGSTPYTYSWPSYIQIPNGAIFVRANYQEKHLIYTLKDSSIWLRPRQERSRFYAGNDKFNQSMGPLIHYGTHVYGCFYNEQGRPYGFSDSYYW